MHILSYLLLICIDVESFGFKLELGHLVPEFDTARRRDKRWDKKVDGQRSGWINIVSNLIF